MIIKWQCICTGFEDLDLLFNLKNSLFSDQIYAYIKRRTVKDWIVFIYEPFI